MANKRVVVSAHFRWIRPGFIASPATQSLAAIAAVEIPLGYTFVTSHDRAAAIAAHHNGNGHQPTTPLAPVSQWIEVRYLVRWRDASGRKYSKHLPAHSGQRLRSQD